MLDRILKQKHFPSPLMIEGDQHSLWIEKIAKAALCESLSSCGHCSSCRLSASSNHPDWISCSGSLGIEDLRSRLLELRRRPFQSKFRVFSFVDFDEASVFVQNALLKTLEEPSAHWVILLGTAAASNALPTIRSRCLFFRLEKSETEEEDASLLEIFNHIKNQSDFPLFAELESIFKSREESKQLWEKLLRKASQEAYPGFWLKLAPELMEAHSQIDRNLNPKILWEHAWTHAESQSH